ncbi:MAG: metal ABC transporter ATP-binding protein, partial [Candidatus Korarchaeum sp.]|nr:metal ABC transporter ATP-binding protein [Candidatus Korarchaeum sp.]
VSYGDEVIFNRETFELVGPGLFLVIGPNGAGKTTLFRALLGLVELKGRVYMNGVDVTGDPGKAGRFAGYVPQLSTIDFLFPISTKEFIESAVILKKRIPALRMNDKRKLLESLASELGLNEVFDKPFQQLSGGQKQRALLARALISDPPILLMDEPLAAVDAAGRDSLIKMILELSERKLFIVSSHDPTLFLEKARAILALNRGIVAMGPPAEVMNEDVMKRVYGRSVMLVERCLHVVDYHAV